MARNDQVTRQWQLLRRLEGSRGASLQELADSLPDGLPRHLRTLRRDLAALESAGFPLVTERSGDEDGFVRRPEFHVLARRLLGRLSSLARFHCGGFWTWTSAA
jgi:predicted DNA-binding transcriptional regulator YafY